MKMKSSREYELDSETISSGVDLQRATKISLSKQRALLAVREDVNKKRIPILSIAPTALLVAGFVVCSNLPRIRKRLGIPQPGALQNDDRGS
jgi:hypothetical protein